MGRWNQLKMLPSERFPNSSKNKDWGNWRSEEESRQPRLQHCYDQLEYSEESWKPEDTCCPFDSSEKLVKTGVKYFQRAYMKYKILHFAELLICWEEYYSFDWKIAPKEAAKT